MPCNRRALLLLSISHTTQSSLAERMFTPSLPRPPHNTPSPHPYLFHPRERHWRHAIESSVHVTRGVSRAGSHTTARAQRGGPGLGRGKQAIADGLEYSPGVHDCRRLTEKLDDLLGVTRKARSSPGQHSCSVPKGLVPMTLQGG